MSSPASLARPRLSGKARKRVRAKSKVLFGNRDRLEVAVAIATSHDRLVNATDLAAEIGLVNSRVRAQLLAFAEVGLLSEVPPTGQDLKRWYVRQESPFWQNCIDLHDEWAR